MRISYFIQISCIFFFLQSCKQKECDRTFFKNMKESYSFDYPLSPVMKEQISGLGLSCSSTKINNVEYYELLLNPDSNLDIEGFLRLKENRVLHTSLDGKLEQLFLDFSSKRGDTWTFDTIDGGQIKIANFNKIYDEYLNDSLQVFEFKIIKSNDYFSGHYPRLKYIAASKNIGFVRISIKTDSGLFTFRLIPFTKVDFYEPSYR